jgi:hypothetical protein
VDLLWLDALEERVLEFFKGALSTIPVRVHEMKAAAELKVPETSGSVRLGVLSVPCSWGVGRSVGSCFNITQ